MSVAQKQSTGMEENCRVVDGHYELPLPFRNKDIKMPYNRKMAVQRTLPLIKKFSKNPNFRDDYVKFMEK